MRVRLVPGVASVADAERLAAQGLHTGFGSDRLKLGGAKMFADGGMGARTIATYEPLADEPTNRGLLVWTSEDMQRAHRVLAGAGWQLITHAIGDRALDQVLDSYEATLRDLDLKDARFRIVHAGLSTPAIQKRLRALNVGVDGNPPFVYWIGSWFRKYGPERVRWAYPGRSYVDAGIVAGGASTCQSRRSRRGGASGRPWSVKSSRRERCSPPRSGCRSPRPCVSTRATAPGSGSRRRRRG